MPRSVAAATRRAILARLGPGGRLVAVDRDPAAQQARRGLLPPIPVSRFRRAWFSELPDVLAALALAQVDGVLLDLGISSPQIDDASARLLFRHDGPLDMRMDTSRGEIRCRVSCPRDGARIDGGAARLW